jgi:nicotinate-nucleotide adenylyltransferase
MAVKGSPMLEALDIENQRQGLSYTIDTLKELNERFGTRLEPFFILGVDAFIQIKTWKEYKELFKFAHFVVIKRPGGIESRDLVRFLSSLNVGFKQTQGHRDRFFVPSGHQLFYMDVTMMDISSTDIRDRISKGKSIRFLVPERVKDYISEKGIYKNEG